MATKLFVAGLAYAMTDNELEALFSEFGTVVSAQIITDRETNRSKGFGFVEFGNDEDAKRAIAGLNGKEMNGRPLTVNEARPREDRPARTYENNRSGGNSIGDNHRRSRR